MHERVNIYIYDLIFLAEKTDICSFANDASSHVCDSSSDFLVKRLEHDENLAIE